jgi:hypothetical protein
MLVNIIQNTISSFRSALAAAEVITTNLKMWLGFETSETLGREEVVNGDFATDSDWSEGTGWDIDEANNKATHTGAGGIIKQTFSNLIVGKHYVASVTLNSVGDTTLSNTSFQIRNNTDTASVAQLLSSSGEILADEINYLTLNFTATQVNNIIRVYSADNIFVTDFSVKELTQITPDKSGNNNVGELFTGKALDFDGAGDYLDISGFSMSGNNATFAFWAYIRDNARADYFFDFQSSTTRFLFGFGQASRELAVYSGGWQDFGNPPQDQWVRIVLTVKGTIAKCFVDGVQLGTDKTISTYDFSSPTTAHIGARYTPETFPKWYDGLLSDFQVYNKAWLNDDIAYDYANPQNLVTDSDNTTIALSNLKAYWAMSEGAGSLTYDSSGEGNNGTINGATYEPAQPRIPQLGMMDWSKGSNLLTYSEDFSQWTQEGSILTTDNSIISPDGNQNASKLQLTGSSSNTDGKISFNITSNATTHTFSVFGKKGNHDYIYIWMNISGGTNITRWIDLDDGSINVGTGIATVTTTSFSNDWWKIEYIFDATNLSKIVIEVADDGVSTGTGGDNIYIWGGQLEESSSASAYRLTDGAATLNSTVIANPTIPTKDIFGNAVRDRLNSFNLGKFGGARPDAFTLSGKQATIQLWFKNVNSNDSLYLADLHSATDRIVLGFNSSQLSVYHEITGSWQNFGTITDGDWNFATFTFDGTSLKCFIGTSQLGVTKTITAINIGTTSDFGIGMNHSFPTRTQDYNGHISDFLFYDRVLTSDEIENNYNAGLSAHTN